MRDFQSILEGEELHVNSNTLEPGASEADDDFDAIRVDDEISVNTAQTDTTVAEAIVASCVRCCFLPKYCANGMSASVKDKVTMNILFGADPSVFLQLSRPILQSIRIGVLEFTDDAMSSICQVLQEYLKSYTYSLSSRMRQITFDLVDTILSRIGPLTQDSFNTGSGELVAFFLNWLGTNLSQGKLVFWEERMSVIRLFARVIQLDPRNEAWANRENESDIEDPVVLLSELVEDTDARVRFRLATMVAGLFHYLPNRNVDALYRNIHTTFQVRGFQVEYTLSILIFQVNITIVSAVGRFSSLFHIYDAAHARKFARGHVLVGLQSIVRALRLSGIAELYLQYASRLAKLQFDADTSPEDLPMHLYGFTGRQQWATAALTAVGTVALLVEKSWVWEHLSATVGLSKEAGLNYIFSVTAGNYLAFAFDARMQKTSDNDWAVLTRILREFEDKFADLGGKGKLVLDCVDTVASAMSMPGDADTTQKMLELLQGQTDGAERSRVFDHIFPAGSNRELEAVLLPVASTQACIRVMQWMETKNETGLVNMIYNVLMQMIGKLHTKILINERLRLVRNLACFVAHYYRSFIDQPILGFVLLRIGAVLAHHVDLVPTAANLISWILPHMRASVIKNADVDLVSIIAKLSAVAMSRFESPPTEGIPDASNAGERIIINLENFLNSLFKGDPGKLRTSAFVPLLPIWPRKLSKGPLARLEEMTRAELLDKAQDPAIHTQIFSLTPQLASKHGAPAGDEIDTFSASVFWQLKDALSSGVEPSAQEVSAFLEVCYSMGGRIRFIDPDTYSALRTKSGKISGRTTLEKSDASQSTTEILLAIFGRLDSPDLGTLHHAYETLCIIGSKLKARISTAKLPSILRTEMGLHRVRPPLQKRNDTALFDFIESGMSTDASLDLAKETDHWASAFAVASCLQLACWDDLLLDAVPLFDHDRRLSRKLLPQMVHLILDQEGMAGGSEQGKARQALSNYTRHVLKSRDIPLATKTVVIEIILYLRRQNRPGSYIQLDNDYWLDLDFSLIAKAALDCKMFATALLYWELHVDIDSRRDAEAKRADAGDRAKVAKSVDKLFVEHDFQVSLDPT